MIKLAVVSAIAVTVMICVTIWVSQQISDVPVPETVSGQVDTTSGQDMQPRWVDNGGQSDGAGN